MKLVQRYRVTESYPDGSPIGGEQEPQEFEAVDVIELLDAILPLAIVPGGSLLIERLA